MNKKFIIIVSIMLVFSTGESFSANFTWVGSNNNFYDGANWNPSGPPNAADDIAFFDNTSAQKSVNVSGNNLNIAGYSVTGDNYAFSQSGGGFTVTLNSTGFVSSGNGTTALISGGSNTLLLSNAPVQGVQFTVSAGTLRFSGSATAGSTVTVSLASSGKLFSEVGNLNLGFVSGTSITPIELSGDLTVGSNNVDGIILNTNVLTNQFGTRTFTKTGTGKLIFTANALTRVNFNINQGSLQLGNNGTSGTVTNPITVSTGTKVIFNHSNSQSRSALINGAGVLRKENSNTLTLTGANGYSGGTELVAGTLIAGNNTAFGSGTINVQGNAALQSDNTSRTLANAILINNGMTLTINGSNNLILNGAISGSGGLKHDASITLTLSGNSNYSGTTLLSGGGTLIAGNNNCFGTGAVSVTESSVLQSNNSSRSVANNFNIVNTKTLTVSGSNNITLAGIISGQGGLTKSGSNTVILSGYNNYSGGTNISSGILQVGSNNIQGTINNNASIVFNQTSDGTYSGNMAGSGTLTKSGTGKLILTGSISISGDVTINGGTLQIDGSMSSNVLANANTTLKGTGSTGNVTSTGATIRPGNSIGTLNINGNLILDPSSTIEIELSPSNSSILNISSSANLDGTLNIVYESGNYSTRDYTILNALAINGTFTNLSANNLPSNITQSVEFLSNSVLLKLVMSSSLTTKTATAQATNVANFLEQVQNTATTEQQNLIDALNGITDSQELDSKIQQIIPSIMSGFQSINILNQQAAPITSRIDSLKNPFYAAGDPNIVHGLWLRPLYENGRQQNYKNVLGYRARTTGIVIGYDRANELFVVGFAGSYAQSNIKSINYYNTSSAIKTYLLSVYGSLRLQDQVYFDGMLSGGKSNYLSNRTIDVAPVYTTAFASYVGHQYCARASLSKNFVKKSYFIMPQLIANYTSIYMPTYSESNAGSLGMSVESSQSDVITLGASLQTSTITNVNKTKIKPELVLGAYYDVKSGSQNVVSSFITGGPTLNTNAAPGRLTGQLGVGVNLALANNLSFKFAYDLLLKQKYYNNVAYINLKYTF